ncbi:hypothetical protein C8R44DRAFT_870347 [Mycena epipterygia]|nr:hypothetical protein C8R44DRAFT_870347 [Mycena epipterygia]
MDDTDSSWCAVCDRQILPKRIIVNIPANPPPSPQHDARRTKRGGLVHGTGRVRANGTIKQLAPPPPVKTRVEIDQSPAPLYCSDLCRQKDLVYFTGFDDSDSSDDTDSLASLSHTSSERAPSQQQQQQRSTPNTRSLEVLQREIGIAPLPPPTSETYDELAPRVKPAPPRALEYTSGVMMANRRLEAVLPKPLKPGERAPPLAPVPGWTDGSQAWRASTYSFAPPPRTRADILDPNRAAYQSFVASPHRSASSGVTASRDYSEHHNPPPSPTAASCSSASSLHSELLSSFEDSFARRTSSRLSLCSSSPASSAAGSPPRKRSRPLATGMLLVPDVLKRATPTESYQPMLMDRGRDAPAPRRHSSGALPASSFPGARMRSPLSSTLSASSDDELPEPEDAEEAAYLREHALLSSVPPRRPAVETRSWSYDNVRTYPVMAMPATVKELRVVNGVEVEVEVPRPLKRLFTFAPIERRRTVTPV